MHRCMGGREGVVWGKATSGGWFWGGCYLFPAACDPIRAGMPSHVGIASVSSHIKSANVSKSANSLSLLDTLFA